jgi:hypothetical protein
MISSEKVVNFITPQTLVDELLKRYPELEDTLIEIAPIFVKLKNPLLRRTIAKITTLRQASVVGNVPLNDLINKLRQAAGEEEYLSEPAEKETSSEPFPEWIKNKDNCIVYDAREDLEKGVHPLAKVMRDLADLDTGKFYLLKTSFIPAPLITKVKEKGYEAYTKTVNGVVESYMRKST